MAHSKHATFEDIPNNTDKCWWKDPCLRMNMFYCLGCLLCPYYIGSDRESDDQALFTGLQALPEWQKYFDHPTGNRLGIISSCIFFPAIVLGFPAAWICGHWGRKWCVIIGSSIMIVGSVWNALATSTGQFMGSRVILGTGLALSKVGAPTLLQESAHPRLRSAVGHIYYGFYYVGALISSVVSSLRGNIRQAREVLAKYHANGDLDDDLVEWECQEIEQTIELEKQTNKSSYLDFFKTPGNRKRFWVAMCITLSVNWCGNGIVAYYLTPTLASVGVDKPVHQISINGGLAIWNMIIANTAGLNADRIGSRPLFLISTIGMIFSYAFVMGFSAGFSEHDNARLGIAAIPFLFLFYGFYDIAWTPLNYSYAIEIMPLGLRAKGTALYLQVQNLGNAFNQWVNPIALASLQWRYYAVYIAIDSCLVVIIYLFFPETKKLSIEEVALVFDYGTKEGRRRAAQAFHHEGTGPKLANVDEDPPIQVEEAENSTRRAVV